MGKKSGGSPESWRIGAIKRMLVALVAIVPLYFSTAHWFPFGVPKTLLVIGGACIVAFLLAWESAARMQPSMLRLSWLHIALAAYLSVLGLAAVSGVDPMHSLVGGFLQPASVALVASCAVIALAIARVARNDSAFVRTILAASFASAVLVALVAYFGNALFSLPLGDGSTIGNSSYAGAYLLFNVCFGVGLLFSAKRFRSRVAYASGIMIIGLCPLFVSGDVLRGDTALSAALGRPVLLAGTAMGAAIGVLVALVCAAAFRLCIARGRGARMFGAGLAIALAVVLVVCGRMLVTPGTPLNRFFAAEKTETRFVFWSIAAAGAAERPLLGWGFGNYARMYETYFDPAIMKSDMTREPWVYQPHNAFWEHRATSGIFGLAAYAALLLAIVSALLAAALGGRLDPWLASAIAGAVAGYAVQNFFVFDTVTTYLMLFTAAGISLAVARPVVSRAASVRAARCAAVLVMAAAAAGFVALAAMPARESREWKRIASAGSLAGIPQAVAAAGRMSAMGGIDDTAHLAEKFLSLVRANGASITESSRPHALVFLAGLADAVDAGIARGPESLRARLVAGGVLNQYALIAEKDDPAVRARAEAHLHRARELSPGNPLPYIALAESRLLAGDVPSARAFVRAALALAPEYEPARTLAGYIQETAPDAVFARYLAGLEAADSRDSSAPVGR